MWHQVLIPSPLIIIPVLVMTTRCHTPKENPDVIVISSKHAESLQDVPVRNNTPTSDKEKLNFETTTKNVIIIMPTAATTIKEENIVSSNEDVVFIPNMKEGVKKKRVEDYWNEERAVDDKMTLHDLMNRGPKLSDIIDPRNMLTEKPNEDIIFITGKNDDTIHKPVKKVEKKKPNEKTYKKHPQAKGNRKLNCSNLDCNNNLESVCGGKLENRQWRYRLFLNECYFRKVNCYFKNKENRYQEVPLYNCHGIATHTTQQFEFQPYQPQQPTPLKSDEPSNVAKLLETRRMASRRSLTTGIDGRLCSHACPTTCPEHYEPECAVSGTGQIRVFMNHCKMDWNSCSYGIVWHQRPLADCVGGKKADMRQNRGFINWMQSVGIIDNKGKLVLN